MKNVLLRSLLVTTALMSVVPVAFAADVTVGSNAIYRIRGNTNDSPGQGVWITSNGSATDPSDAEAGIEINSTQLDGISDSSVKLPGAGQVKFYGTTVMTGETYLNDGTTVTGNVNLNGATNINTTTTANTDIGNTTGTTSLTGSTNTVTGATNINAALNDTAATTIGRDGNKTSLNSNDIEIGTGKYATTVDIGSTDATSVNATSGNSGMSLVKSGVGAVVDSRGRITTGDVQNVNTAALGASNDAGSINGIIAQPTKTVVSGGDKTPTSLTLRDNGATFSNSLNGAPVRVMGVADGVASYDAVNVRQLRGVYAGIAGTAAMANIPSVDPGKRFALGVGLGGFKGQGAVAVGASLRLTDNAQIKASVSTSTNTDTGSRNTAFAIGGGLSF